MRVSVCALKCHWANGDDVFRFTAYLHSTSSWRKSLECKRRDRESVRNLLKQLKNSKRVWCLNTNDLQNCNSNVCAIPMPQLTIPAWTHGEPGADWTIKGPPLSPYKITMRWLTVIVYRWLQCALTDIYWTEQPTYTARVFSWISSTNHVIDNASRSVAAIFLLAFRVRNHLNGDLLQHRWLTTTFKLRSSLLHDWRTHFFF